MGQAFWNVPHPRNPSFTGREEKLPKWLLVPLEMLRESIQAVPANAYALGVVGIVAAAAISLMLTGGNWVVSLAGGIAAFAGMVVLRIFAQSETLTRKKTPKAPVDALFLTWTCLIGFTAVLGMLIGRLYFELFPDHPKQMSEPKPRLAQGTAELREQMEELARHSREVRKIMHDGSILILGSDNITKEYQRSLGENPSANDFLEHLGPNKTQFHLAVVIRGLENIPALKELKEHLAAMTEITKGLTGGFAILKDPVVLLNNIAGDSYSFSIFLNILSIDPKMLLRDSDATKDVSALSKALAAELQSNSALYYVARHEEATTYIDNLINILVSHFKSLSDDMIEAMKKCAVVPSDGSDTFTRHMRLMFRKISSTYSSEEEKGKVVDLIEDIERSTSKKRAGEVLEEMKERKMIK